jgi:hypothetical protein
MKKIIASGQLRHYFFGSYVAAIALIFETEENVNTCLPLLGDGWYKLETNKNAIGWYGFSQELTVCERTLMQFGADINKINSIKSSSGFGEEFEVSFKVDITPEEQRSLF